MTDSDTLAAEFYVALHRGTPHDVAFYQRATRGAASVLELGCGDGRVLTRLNEVHPEGERVGLDSDPGMLSLARRAAAACEGSPCRFIRADIGAFDLGRQFECILLPYSTLWCLPDAAKLACLRLAANHAAAGARLFLDVYPADELIDDPDEPSHGGDSSEFELSGSDEPQVRDAELEESEFDDDEPEVDEREFLVELDVRDQRYRVFEEDRIWPTRPMVEARFDFESVGSPRAGLPQHHEQLIVHHPCRVAQLSELLSAAGFEQNELTDAFGAPYIDDSGAQLFVSARLREQSR